MTEQKVYPIGTQIASGEAEDNMPGFPVVSGGVMDDMSG